ncbi:hypothetical protein HFD88_005239 [Aspergillus terreus]|nr:hypothetical protein HFD88_005239 [Aspergillus terreus]
MGDFRGFIHGLVETTRGLLDKLLFCAADQPAPAIPWGRLYDNPVEGKAGWSFLCDSRMTWPVDSLFGPTATIPPRSGHIWLEQQSPAPRELLSTQERALLWGSNPGTRRAWSSDRFCENTDERHERERAITDPDNKAAMDDEQWPGYIADL